MAEKQRILIVDDDSSISESHSAISYKRML